MNIPIISINKLDFPDNDVPKKLVRLVRGLVFLQLRIMELINGLFTIP